MSWFSGVWRRQAREQELDSELRFHLERQIQDNLAAGLDPAEARRQAALAFGGLEQIKEQCREQRAGRWVPELLQDLRFGVRTLGKSPGFTVAALATIAIGVGANAAIFSFVDAVLLKPVPYPEFDRVMNVAEYSQTYHNRWWVSSLNYLDWVEWVKQNGVFENLAACTWDSVACTGNGEPIQLTEERASAHCFDILRLAPALGRTFADGEDQPGKEKVVVLTNRIWVKLFASDPSVIGRKVVLDGEPNTIIGVMPAGFLDRFGPAIYRPLAFFPQDLSREWRHLDVIARLKPGVTLENARAQMTVLGDRIAREHPSTNQGMGIAVFPESTNLVPKDLRQSLWLLLCATAAVLLIGCANLANLTLARGVARNQEVAIRAALGAGRGRLIRQFLTESLLLSAVGGLLGLVVAYYGMGALARLIPPFFVPSYATIAMDGRVVAFALGITALTTVMVGLIPALRASTPNLTQAIKEGGAGTGSGQAFRRLRGLFVVAEVAVAFVLLCGAGLMIRSFFRLQDAPTGFDSTNVLTATLPIAPKRFSTSTAFGLYLHQIEDRIGSLPGVHEVALANALPMQSPGMGMWFRVVGEKEADASKRPSCIFKQVTPSYFPTLGMRLIAGRLPNEHDGVGALPVTVISEAMARRVFPHENPIGKHILVAEFVFAAVQFGAEIPWEVIGVVNDERIGNFRAGIADYPTMYVPEDQSLQIRNQRLLVRTSLDPNQMRLAIGKAMRELNPDQVIDAVETLDDIKAGMLGPDRLRSSLLAIFAGAALLLAGVGIYGVISYSVVQRTREIGIRTALGATSADVLRIVLRSGMGLTAVGLAIGLVATIGLSQLLTSMLFGVGRFDPATLAVVAAVLLVTALLACYIPARRAMKVNPIVALRCE